MKVGDTVNLKAGGAIMTVVAVDGDTVTTMWTDNQLQPHEIVVPEAALEPAEDLVEVDNN